MYCVKCSKVTETDNITTAKCRNGRAMARGRCRVCGKTKTQFIKGAGLFNTVVNKLPFELHLPGHNFTGPGTRLDRRLNPDGTPHAWSMPINRVDTAAYHHDLCYAKHKDTKTRNEVCDKEMLNELDGILNPTLREKIDRALVRKIISSRVKFGLGVPIQKKISNGATNWLKSSINP